MVPVISKRPEDELILCTARTRLGGTHAERVAGLLRDGVDWISLLDTANRHGTLPLFYHHVQAVCPESVPAPALNFLRARCERIGQVNLHLTSELLRVLEALRNQGIVAVPYKGPVLAALAYGNLGLRVFEDLDIVVRQSDVARAWEALAAAGYRSSLDGVIDPLRLPERIPGQYPFENLEERSVVELHTERTLRYFPKRPDLDRCAETLEPVFLGGQQVFSFLPEHALAFICVHGCKHFWDRLLWICDVAELAQIPRGLDWDRAFENARQLRCERMVFLGLYLANELLEAPLPEPVLRKVKRSAEVRALARVVSTGIFRGSGCSPGIVERFLFRVRMAQGFWAGLGYTLRLATTPTVSDWQMLRLPEPLAPLVVLLRPYRLLREYGLQAGRSAQPNPAQPDYHAVLHEMDSGLAGATTEPRAPADLPASKAE